MTTYRHRMESLVVKWCMAPGTAAGYCGCTTPTPDDVSPCGWRNEYGETCDAYLTNHGYDEHCEHRMRADCHPHVPTRCTCGHPIEHAE